MLKKTITYVNYNDEKVTEDFYFNLTKTEMIELASGSEEGFMESLEKVSKMDTRPDVVKATVTKSEDKWLVVGSLKKLILMAYGEKTADGKQFVKSDASRLAFSQTVAYDILFSELTEDATAGETFLRGVFPKELVSQINFKEIVQQSQDVQPPVEIMGPPEVVEIPEPQVVSNDEIRKRLSEMTSEEKLAFFNDLNNE